MKTINYQTVIEYYRKQGCIIKPGIDTLVYDLGYSPQDIDNFYKDYAKYSTNSQDKYFTLENYPNIDFKTTANRYKQGLALNISFSSFDTPTVEAMQIYINQDVQKLTVYGLFFRFCELSETDWQEFMHQILMKIGYQPNIERLIRGDYKIDIIGVSPDDFLLKMKNNNRSITKRISTIYQKQGEIETVYLGNRSSKYAFPRIYDKNKDTLKKGKEVFYKDYLNHPTTRLEIQTGSNFTGDLSTEQRVDKIKTYIGDKNGNYKGNYYVGRRYDPNFILNTDFFQKRLKTALLKAVHNGINLQPTFDQVNAAQSYYSFTFISNKGLVLTSRSTPKELLFQKEKPNLSLRQ